MRRALLLALFSMLPIASRGEIIGVPADVNRVSMALVVAAPYDTILVAPGIYYENLIWPNKAGIKLLSEEGCDATVLDGRNRDQVIGIYSGVDTTTVVRGFTIRNGHAEGM